MGSRDYVKLLLFFHPLVAPIPPLNTHTRTSLPSSSFCPLLPLIHLLQGDLVGTISSLTLLGLQPPPEWMAAFIEECLNQLRTMGSRDYVKLLLFFHPLVAPIPPPNTHTRTSLPSSSFRPLLPLIHPLQDDLVGTISSLTLLGLQPPPEWMAAFVEAGLNQLRTMGSRDYVKVLLFFHPLVAPIPPLNTHTRTSLPSSSFCPLLPLIHLLQDDLVGTISSLTLLGLQPPPEWMAAFVEASLNQLRTMGSRDYIKLLLGLATAGWRPADPGQFAALLDRSFPLMGYMQALEMSQLAWALAQFGMPVSPQWAKVGLWGEGG